MRRNRLFTGVTLALALSAMCGSAATAQTSTADDAKITRAAAYAVGSGPEGVVSDGANVWVANQFGDTVTKLSSDGAAVGSYPVGRRSLALAFDGNFVWVTNSGSGSISKR